MAATGPANGERAMLFSNRSQEVYKLVTTSPFPSYCPRARVLGAPRWAKDPSISISHYTCRPPRPWFLHRYLRSNPKSNYLLVLSTCCPKLLHIVACRGNGASFVADRWENGLRRHSAHGGYGAVFGGASGRHEAAVGRFGRAGVFRKVQRISAQRFG